MNIFSHFEEFSSSSIGDPGCQPCLVLLDWKDKVQRTPAHGRLAAQRSKRDEPKLTSH